VTEEIPSNLPDQREKKTYYLRMTLARRILTPLTKGLLWFFARSQANGAENFPASGPVILAANHLTMYDPLSIQFALSRPIFFIAKEELFRHPLTDWLFRQAGCFPVHRETSDLWAFRHALQVLKNGLVLGIFPEGTRNRGEGLHAAKTGAARLARTIGCPIVPVAIQGTQDLFRHFPRRVPISITFGAPIYLQPGETHLGLTDRLMFALAEMLPPEARGAYSYRPPGF
jgi:1-acyl-sn-glycerol-3-phosphate acyltransferase